jgi:hypothetical protein
MHRVPSDRKHLKRRGRRSIPPVVAAILIFAVAVCLPVARAWAQSDLRLEVVACDTQEVLLQMDITPETEFSIRFLHSYDRAPFEEHYRVIGRERILLTHMTFKGSLNGQGFVLGTYRPVPGGAAELADIDQELERVTFRLGSPDLADHTLSIGGRRLRLLDYAEAGTLLCIRVR